MRRSLGWLSCGKFEATLRAASTSRPLASSAITAIGTCRGAAWPQALQILQLLLDHKTYGAAAFACSSAVWETSLALLAGVMELVRRMEVGIEMRNAAFMGCAALAMWQHAIAGLSEPSVVSFNLLLNACEGAAQWKLAIEIMCMMSLTRLRPSAASHRALCESCRGHWQHALTTHHAPVWAHEKGGQHRVVAQMLEDIQEDAVNWQERTIAIAGEEASRLRWMSFLHVSSALTGELILRSPLPEDADWQYIKEEIRAATGVAHFCQQLLFQEQILDGSTWLRLGRPTQLQVAFQSPSDQASQLLRAASAGAAADVAALLRRFQDPNAADESGDTTLVKASEGGHVEVVQLLLDAAALPGSAPSGAVPLLLAASQGHREVVQCLLWAEADPEARDDVGSTGLCLAAEGGFVEVARTLLVRADVDGTNRNGERPLMIAAQRGFFTFMNLMLRAGADKDAVNLEGQTALMAACARGDVRGVRCLLDACAQINKVNKAKRTGLYLAAAAGHLEALRLLLERRADPDLQDQHGCTPLFLSAQIGHSGAVRSLLEARANTEFKSDVGRSALTTASQCGHVAVVHELLEARAAIETLALRYAVTHGHEEIVQCLLHELQAQGDLKAGLR
ncbi:Ankyrin repeat domain-containing protein 50 [Durusdinium trenchii]|uniref:Ankyrin repeat domain-containing protein 50 n=1 Tax=Durusdinium trenchii TaxID=1381693 RepID=A0ABP0IV30_9DINO